MRPRTTSDVVRLFSGSVCDRFDTGCYSVSHESVQSSTRLRDLGGDLIVRMEIEFPCLSTFQIERRQTGRAALVVVHLFDTPAEVSGSSAETVFAGSCACRAVFQELLRTLPATP